MSNSSGQQSDRGELVGLGKLSFQFHPLGDVVHDDQPTDHAEFFCHERSNRHIHGPGFTRGNGHAELV